MSDVHRCMHCGYRFTTGESIVDTSEGSYHEDCIGKPVRWYGCPSCGHIEPTTDDSPEVTYHRCPECDNDRMVKEK